METQNTEAPSHRSPSSTRSRTALKLGIPAAFLLCFAWLLLKPAPNPPGIAVGPPLPPGKVTPQLSYNYGGARALISSDGSLSQWETVPNWDISAPLPLDPPKRIGSESNWSQVCTILGHALALKTDGSLWAWGQNDSGALGQPNARLQTNDPIRIGSDTNWKHIAIGAGHCLALKNDGSLWAWGQNDHGQIGDGTKSNKFAVTQIGSDHDWSAISAGAFASYALKNDGSLWGWGCCGSPADEQLLPRRIEAPGRITAISANDFLLLALRFDGTLWICGPNAHAAASSYVKTATPFLVQIGKDNYWTEIYAGTCGFFARKKDFSWWFSGMIKNGYSLATPRRLPINFDPWSFAPKLGDALFLTRDGAIWLLTVEPETGKFVTAVKKLKGFVNQATAHLPGNPRLFSPNDYPIRATLQKVWALPSESSPEKVQPR